MTLKDADRPILVWVAEMPLSELLEEMVQSMAARWRGVDGIREADLCQAIQQRITKDLGECAICGALAEHGSDYDQFTDQERLAHEAQASMESL